MILQKNNVAMVINILSLDEVLLTLGWFLGILE